MKPSEFPAHTNPKIPDERVISFISGYAMAHNIDDFSDAAWLYLSSQIAELEIKASQDEIDAAFVGFCRGKADQLDEENRQKT